MRRTGAALILATTAAVYGTNYMSEDFNGNDWTDRWVVSEWKPSSEIGQWAHTAGDWYADEADKGIKTSEDARFYGISEKLDQPFDNKDKDLVIQYLVKHEQTIDCGGAYIKLLPSGLDQSKFGGDSAYSIMFGPDICGGTVKTHAILNYARPKGETEAKNMDHNGNIRCERDEHAHLYTFILKKDNTYQVKIDGEEVKSGELASGWSFQPPKEIEDPSESKPEDWVDEAEIPDPDHEKPNDYDDIPALIIDPEATKPEDWDDEDDGEWEPPMIDNPDYQGPWTPRMIENPDYKGPWVHPKIPNPEYFQDDNMYHRCNPCEYVGFELWQVKSGTLFDDILITDDVEQAATHAETVMKKIKALTDVKEKKDEEAKKEQEEAIKEAEEAIANDEAKKEETDVEEDEQVAEKDEL